jgi:HKD family nuclease
MKKTIIAVAAILVSTIAFSQKDSIWIAKYQSVNGVTKYLGSTTLTQSYTNITDSKLKVIGTVDAAGNLVLTAPKKTLMMGRYAVYNSMGQMLYLVKID